ncbi:MAG: hypothetical protein GWO24_36990, partial [Akkermansiaceae bacterium]|nr:hypothetical protein [Akkermansiaceae bacterium]
MKRSPAILACLVAVLAALAPAAFAGKKKVVFLADRGKTGQTHAHVGGNALLAKALE